MLGASYNRKIIRPKQLYSQYTYCCLLYTSTGIATEVEIKEAVDAIRAEGNNDITLLKCTSAYPAKIDQANLLTMPDMKEKFGVKVGVSDHTFGSLVPMTAVALGAEVVEKHFIIDRSIGGPDSDFSMNAEEFAQMVKDVRNLSLIHIL